MGFEEALEKLRTITLTPMSSNEWIEKKQVLAVYREHCISKTVLAELLKNRPKIKTDESFDGMLHVFYDNTEIAKFFKELEGLTQKGGSTPTYRKVQKKGGDAK